MMAMLRMFMGREVSVRTVKGRRQGAADLGVCGVLPRNRALPGTGRRSYTAELSDRRWFWIGRDIKATGCLRLPEQSMPNIRQENIHRGLTQDVASVARARRP